MLAISSSVASKSNVAVNVEEMPTYLMGTDAELEVTKDVVLDPTEDAEEPEATLADEEELEEPDVELELELELVEEAEDVEVDDA